MFRLASSGVLTIIRRLQVPLPMASSRASCTMPSTISTADWSPCARPPPLSMLAARAIMATMMVMTTINSTRVNPLTPAEKRKCAALECAEKFLIQVMQD